MGNIFDYLKWRGDLTFLQDGFNEIDNLLLSYLAYVNLDGLSVGAGEAPVTTVRNFLADFLFFTVRQS